MSSGLPEIVLQVEQADGRIRCTGFSGVPAARASWVAVVSSGSAAARQHAEALGSELETALLASSPVVQAAVIDCPDPPETFDPARYSDRRKVLALVGSRDRPFDDLPWYANWDSERDEACVMTVLPPGSFLDFFEPAIQNNPSHVLLRTNASRWQRAIGEALPALMARADITSLSPRCFISYRRLETQAIAAQLFDQLAHEGFDVFLDRYSIPAGFDFQRRLTQELEDKSMVVLLESRFLHTSKWTQHEIDYVKRNRLGLATLRMPDVQPTERVRSATIGAHVDLDANDFVRAPDLVANPDDPQAQILAWPALTDAAVQRVVAAIKRAHAEALFLRRHRLRQDVVWALRSVGLKATDQSVGPIVVSTDSDTHLVWLTTRPPEVDDFQSLWVAHLTRADLSPSPNGLIVGPRAAQEPDRLQRLDWLHRVTDCLSFDEGNLIDFARRVKNQQWH